MTSAAVAIACCRASDTAAPTELYPDPDAGVLRNALGEFGARSALVAWDDPDIDWAAFDVVIVSSTWDSVDRPTEYLEWTMLVSALSTLLNPADVIEWGIDKTHQQALAEGGVPVIPTTWLAPGEMWQPPETEFVVKPCVSAGGRATARYDSSDLRQAEAHVGALHRAGQTAMVQPYLHAIDEVGELDVVFIGGAYSHAVRKCPTLQLGEGIVERPWERMAWSGVATPDPLELEIATKTMRVVSELFRERVAYGRVDLVPDNSGKPVVLEVELIDPYLSLDMVPEAATRLARTIVDHASR